MSELLPCPFCGGEGKLYDDYISERDEHRWQVWHVCDNGPEGESAGYGKAYHTSIDTPWFKSCEKAAEAWNTRQPPRAFDSVETAQRVAELEQELEDARAEIRRLERRGEYMVRQIAKAKEALR